MKSKELDSIDKRILTALQKDARMSLTDLARQVGLSKTPVANRIKQMEDMGLIVGYRAILSPLQLGLTNVSYVQVNLSDTTEKALDKFNEAVRMIPEVEECYMIAGGFDYLLKVRSRDMQDYRRVMGDKISALPYVYSTSTHVAMEAVVEHSEIEFG